VKQNDDLLREILEEHAHNSTHDQKLESFSHPAEYPSNKTGNTCHIQLKIQEECLVKISAQVNGSALAKACASIMCSEMKGLSLGDIQTQLKQLAQWTKDTQEEPVWKGDLLVYQSLVHYPERMDCAMLGWKALEKAISSN
jgi:nitrogen fixation NifU-like protein